MRAAGRCRLVEGMAHLFPGGSELLGQVRAQDTGWRHCEWFFVLRVIMAVDICDGF